MDIYLTPVGGKKIRFPMLPEKINTGADAKFMTYSIISLGDVKIPRGKGIKEIYWSGMFPGEPRKKNQLVREFVAPDTMIADLEKIRDEGTTCDLMVTGTAINNPVKIASFKGKYSGGSGDYFYDIKFIINTDIKIYTTDELKMTTPTQRPKPEPATVTQVETKKEEPATTQTYVVQDGDCPWRIAQRFLGDGSRYPEIYNLNADKLVFGGDIYTGQVLTIPIA